MVDNPDPSRPEPKPTGNSAAYLRSRLEAEGFHQLIEAIDRGELSVYGAACAVGIRKRPPTLSGADSNQSKVRAVAVARAIGELPPLVPSPRANGGAKHSIAPAPRAGMPDLEAALAECQAMHAPRSAQPTIDVAELPRPASSRERLVVERMSEPTSFPFRSDIPCTGCQHPRAAAALYEILSVYVGARKGDAGLTGPVLPHQCCRRLFQHVDPKALIG